MYLTSCVPGVWFSGWFEAEFPWFKVVATGAQRERAAGRPSNKSPLPAGELDILIVFSYLVYLGINNVGLFI